LPRNRCGNQPTDFRLRLLQDGTDAAKKLR
jgi:hypothetical protein